MTRRRARPKVDSVWAYTGNDEPGRRIRIVALHPQDDPQGVEARVLSSVSWDRRVFMAFRDLHDNYEMEVT